MRRGRRDELEHSGETESGEVTGGFQRAELDTLGNLAHGAVPIGLRKEPEVGGRDFKRTERFTADVTQDGIERGDGFVKETKFVHLETDARDEYLGIVHGEIARQVGGHRALVEFVAGLAPGDKLEQGVKAGIGPAPRAENDAVFNRNAAIERAFLELEITGRLDADNVPENGG